MFICDYGDTWQARFHPSRAQGTLRAFTRQQIAADPLATPGMQDLTADVDFSTVLSAAETAGLTVRAYATQAQFLLAHGLIERLQRHDPQDTVTYLALAQQVKTLVSPEALGERFKVAWLTREAD
jgi:SAM-dependent MidA family methyltransferase